jgi:TolB-like protein/Tfp pilus assembly protein PilF
MGKESLIREDAPFFRAEAVALPLCPRSVLQIGLLGSLTISDDDGPLDLPGAKDRALLAYLAASPGVPAPRAKLAALLWGDVPERQSRDSLKQAVWHLRKALDGVAALGTDRQSLSLDPASVTVDAVAFCDLLASNLPEDIEQAIALYRGDFLEGLDVRSAAFEDWMLIERQRLRHQATDAMAALLDRQFADGRREQAAVTAQRLMSLEPLHEGACRSLMRIHAERGQRNQALKLFETLRQRLRETLDVRPEPATSALYDSIRGTVVPVAAQAERAPERATKPSIAVLPFANIGHDPEQDYFAAGLTEDVITDLSQISGLAVLASLRAHGAVDLPSAREAARALNARYLLDGSVRKSGDRVRITALLVDAESGAHLWAERYDRDMADIFSVQDEIARSLADVLRVRLQPGDLELMTTRPTASPEAYKFYLLGRSFYLRGLNRSSLRVARDLFARAMEIDPHYARTYSSVAICDYYLSMSDASATPESMFVNSARALELAPDLADAHAAKGLALYGVGRYNEAAVEFDRAMTLDPKLFEAHFFQARCCRLRGDHEEAVALFEKAAELRPDDFRSIGLLAEENRVLGRMEAFGSAAARCLRCVEQEVKDHPDNAGAWAFGSNVLAMLGETERGEEWAERAVIIVPDDHLVHYNVSRTHAILGRHDRALEWLERSLSAMPAFRFRLLAWLKADPGFDTLRANARFCDIVHGAELR